MSELSNFLMKNSISDLTREVELTGRLEGMKFKVKVMTSREYENYQKICQKIVPGKKEFSFDGAKFRLLVLKNHVIDPDFTNAEMLSQAGFTTPEEFISDRLLVGEQALLQDAILSLSGFDSDLKSDIDEAKN